MPGHFLSRRGGAAVKGRSGGEQRPSRLARGAAVPGWHCLVLATASPSPLQSVCPSVLTARLSPHVAVGAGHARPPGLP